MPKVLISFVGGRPLPNVQFILDVKPDNLYLVVSKDSYGKGSNHEKLVNALPADLKPLQSYPVAPYNLHRTVEACEEIIKKYPDDEIILNLASEPTPMSLGAYQFVQELKQKGKNVQLSYSSRDGVVDILGEIDNPQPVQISMRDYFAAYGWDVKINRETEENKRLSAALIAQNLVLLEDVLEEFRGLQRQKGQKKITRQLKTKINTEQYDLLEKMRDLGILSEVKQTETDVSCTISGIDNYKFLKSEWLEVYVYNTAKDLKNSGEPLFHECGWGVKDQTKGRKNDKGELDFVGVFGGQLLIASCKTGKSIERKFFDELYTRGEQLGKGMCTKLLVTSARPTKQDREKAENRAKDREIILVCGDELPKLGDILKKQAIKPTYRRI